MKTPVLMHERFVASYNKLDGSLKSRIIDFMVKLQTNSDAPGLDFKQPQGAASKWIRTARVNDQYRAVLIEAGAGTSGRTLYLLAVRNHDDAYGYASNVSLQVNEKTGAAEIVDLDTLAKVLAAEPASAAPSATPAQPIMPSKIRPQDLERFGIAADVAERLRSVTDENQLLAICEALPKTQGQAALDLAYGADPDLVWSELVDEEPGEIDVEDVEAALGRSISRLNFMDADSVSGNDDLRAALEGELADWRIWLHPLQRRVAEHDGWNGPFRITGGAGTGKTVVALHRARHLAQRMDQDGVDGKILFTTFTKNLAEVIKGQLTALAGPGIHKRVDVVNIDALARRVVRAGGNIKGSNDFADLRPVHEEDPRVIDQWRTAASGGEWDIAFLAEEWSDVVLGHAITAEKDYFRVPRAGRGQRLSRPQRAKVWTTIERFEQLLRASNLATYTQVASRGAELLVADPGIGAALGYRHAIIDEAQDLHPTHWKLLRTLIPEGQDDLFIAGDAHQRIYGKPSPLSRYGIEIRGRSRRLTLNYRTSRQILGWCLEAADAEVDDLDTETETLDGARSLFGGPEPRVLGFASPADEMAGLIALIRDWTGAEDSFALAEIGVLAREKRFVREAIDALRAAQIDAVEISDTGDGSAPAPGVRVGTMHRAKGLEFRAVALIRLGAADYPPAFVRKASGLEKDALEKQEQRLLYVAGSRAREELAVLSS